MSSFPGLAAQRRRSLVLRSTSCSSRYSFRKRCDEPLKKKNCESLPLVRASAYHLSHQRHYRGRINCLRLPSNFPTMLGGYSTGSRTVSKCWGQIIEVRLIGELLMKLKFMVVEAWKTFLHRKALSLHASRGANSESFLSCRASWRLRFRNANATCK